MGKYSKGAPDLRDEGFHAISRPESIMHRAKPFLAPMEDRTASMCQNCPIVFSESGSESKALEEEDGVYFIKNTVDEWRTRITGYFRTFDDAKEALKECSDWYRSKGTGQIYFQKFGADQYCQMVFEA